jgi:transposase InsO family protein
MEALHNDMGHPGKNRMLSLIRDRFYRPGMDKAVDEWISQCGRCIRRKTPASSQRALLVSISTQLPLELVCIDFLTLEHSKGGHHNILVITEHFTRFAQAISTRNQTAKTTAQTLFDSFIVHYGIPQQIHSDQGANFESKVVKELCTLTGMKSPEPPATIPWRMQCVNALIVHYLGC